ncbi:hypothetical protein B0H14DRAFT_2583469 [Mycena olivaceomarginata]|nr:hypothetical protein B0H14DRAFT_2583469 [Mycena olivaceomarginata]
MSTACDIDGGLSEFLKVRDDEVEYRKHERCGRKMSHCYSESSQQRWPAEATMVKRARQAKLKANHNNGQTRSAQQQISAFELSLTMNPVILNLSLDHHARDTQYLKPQTNISSTSHSTESAETYGIGDDSGTTRQGLGIGVDVIRPRCARNRRLYGTYLRPLGVALPDSLRAVLISGARAFAGAQGNAEAREQARLGSASTLANRYTALPNSTRSLRGPSYTASICLSNAKRRLASVRVLDLRIPPGPPKRFGSRIATNTARHDTVDIPGRAQHTHAAIRCSPAVVKWPSPLDHRVPHCTTPLRSRPCPCLRAGRSTPADVTCAAIPLSHIQPSLNGLQLFFVFPRKKQRCKAKAKGRWSASSANSYSRRLCSWTFSEFTFNLLPKCLKCWIILYYEPTPLLCFIIPSAVNMLVQLNSRYARAVSLSSRMQKIQPYAGSCNMWKLSRTQPHCCLGLKSKLELKYSNMKYLGSNLAREVRSMHSEKLMPSDGINSTIVRAKKSEKTGY